MGELVHWLNTAGGVFVAWSGPMLIQSSVLILILAALDLVLRKRVKAVVRYWIWLLVLAKLILPPSVSSPTGLAYWISSKLSVPPAPVESVASVPRAPAPPNSETIAFPLSGALDPSSAAAPTAPTARLTPAGNAPPASLTPCSLALLAWSVVVVVMAVLLIQRALFVRSLVAQSQEAPPEVAELLQRCRRRVGVRTDVTVRLSPLSASPSVCGLWRPVILIPAEMLAQLQSHELRSVLCHELAHVQRGDLWLNLVQALLQVVYFYHPLLWWANAQIRRVREQAVDETVLAALGEDAEDYPRTLLSISRLAFGQPTLSLRLLGVAESKRALTERIRHIVSRPFPQTAKLGWIGAVLVVVIAVTLLPMASAAPERAKTAAASQAGAGAPVDQITWSGRVLDSQDKPVAGAEVTFYLETAGEIGILPIIQVLDRKMSGADGAFSFAVPKTAKDYREGHVIARKAGLALIWADWPMQEDQHLDLRLPTEPKELAGDVVDEAGRPIAEAEVHIALAKIGKGENRRELRSTGFLRTKTDRNGHFVFADMPAEATFEFLVEAPGRAPIGTCDMTSRSGERCQYVPGQTGIRFTLPKEARIEGIVVEKAGGKPIGGIEVAAHGDRRGSGVLLPSRGAVTAPDGTFHLSGLSDGACILELWRARGQMPEWVAEDVHTFMKAGETKRDIRMRLTKGAIIEVRVKDTTGKPVEKVYAYLQRVGQEQDFGDRADENGLARIRVLAGDYKVGQLYRPGYAPPQDTPQVTVQEGETKRVECTMTAMPKITGIVRDNEAGRPLAGVKVQVTWIKMLSSGGIEATSDASGEFEILWLTTPLSQGASTVILVARDPLHNLVETQEIDDHTGPLDLKLQPGVIVTGTAVDQEGQPLPGATARALLRVDKATLRLSWKELATAGPNGTFEIKALPPEREYTVEVEADGYGKQEVHIAALGPQEKQHDIGRIKLTPSGLSISGIVVDPNDEPVVGVEVSAFGTGQPNLHSVQTDAQGRFTIKGVCPGPIHLNVDRAGCRTCAARLRPKAVQRMCESRLPSDTRP